MALTNEELQDIISNISPEERKQLLSLLGRQVEVDNITNPTQSTNTKPKVKPKSDNSKVYCCPLCGSASYKKHGTTTSGMQRYICKDCEKTFSKNYGDSLRYTHLSESQWLNILRGIVNNHSLPQIARDCGISKSTAWSCRMKINQAIMTMYVYSDLFHGTTQADEYYCRAAFKGKRDPEFFIYTLRRMPRHNRNYYEKVEYLQQAGLYDKLKREEPEYLQQLLEEEPKMKRGISNEQICILTLVDENNKLYLEPVSVGRLEKAMAKAKLKPKFTSDEHNVFVTDDHNAYNRILYGTKAKHEVVPASKHTNTEVLKEKLHTHSYKMFCRKERIEHVIIESELHTAGAYSLSRINSLHSSIERFFGSKECLPATKYIDLYLKMFWWLQKNKDLSSNDLTSILFKLVTGYVDNTARAKMTRTTIKDLVTRELPIDTKGFY